MSTSPKSLRSKARKGFTLIELLVVVIIIGILAAISVSKFADTKKAAYVASMKADARNLAAAYESDLALNPGTASPATTAAAFVLSPGNSVLSGGTLPDYTFAVSSTTNAPGVTCTWSSNPTAPASNLVCT